MVTPETIAERLRQLGTSLEIVESGIVLHDPQGALDEWEQVLAVACETELLSARYRAIFALSRVNQDGVSLTLRDGEVLHSCPVPDLDVIRKHSEVWKQFVARVQVLTSLGESEIHATRRAWLEMVHA